MQLATKYTKLRFKKRRFLEIQNKFLKILIAGMTMILPFTFTKFISNLSFHQKHYHLISESNRTVIRMQNLLKTFVNVF